MTSLPDDVLTGGLLSRLLTDTWLQERQGQRRSLANRELVSMHQIMTDKASSLFDRVPESVAVPSEEFRVNHPDGREAVTGLERDWLSSGSDMEERNIRFFGSPGFIFYDGVHASAFGRFKYVYRAKGVRIIWTADGVLRLCTIHATLDHHGFYLAHEEFDAYEISEERPGGTPTDISGWAGDPEGDEDFINGGDVYFWMKQLANINQPYSRDYFIEYLVNPPDVQELSNFSVEIRRSLWQSIFRFAAQSLAAGFTSEEHELLNFALRFMERIKVEPPLQTRLLSLSNCSAPLRHPRRRLRFCSVRYETVRYLSRSSELWPR